MFDKYSVKNKIQKSNICQTFNLKIKGYKMKLSTIALATTVALTFSGCVIDDALNSVTGAIDSITTPNGTANTSTKSNIPTKNFNSTSELEKFCANAPKKNSIYSYKITKPCMG